VDPDGVMPVLQVLVLTVLHLSSAVRRRPATTNATRSRQVAIRNGIAMNGRNDDRLIFNGRDASRITAATRTPCRVELVKTRDRGDLAVHRAGRAICRRIGAARATTAATA
jgi:hypothetical protein